MKFSEYAPRYVKTASGMLILMLVVWAACGLVYHSIAWVDWPERLVAAGAIWAVVFCWKAVREWDLYLAWYDTKTLGVVLGVLWLLSMLAAGLCGAAWRFGWQAYDSWLFWLFFLAAVVVAEKSEFSLKLNFKFN